MVCGTDDVSRSIEPCAVVTISIVVTLMAAFTGQSSKDNGGLVTGDGCCNVRMMSHSINPKPVKNPQMAPYRIDE